MKVQNFNEHVEKSLDRLGRQIEGKLEVPEARPLPEREVVKQSVQEFAKTVPAPQKQDDGKTEEKEEKEIFPEYFNTAEVGKEVERAVKTLVATALQDDLEKAIQNSKQYPPFVEDAFHDALVDKLLPELKKRGILK